MIKTREAIAKVLSESFVENKEAFSYESPDCILHQDSNIFYDPENYAVGYMFRMDDSSDPEYRMINLTDEQIEEINNSFSTWLNWYHEQRDMELLGKLAQK